MVSDPKLSEICNRLVQAFHPLAIHLFGSKARGDATVESDYDLVMVVKQSSEPMYKRIQRVRPILRGIGVAVDIIVMTEQEFQSQSDVVASLPATVLREGKKLDVA